MAGYKEEVFCWRSRGAAGYKENVVGGVGEWPATVVGGVGEWPATVVGRVGEWQPTKKKLVGIPPNQAPVCAE